MKLKKDIILPCIFLPAGKIFMTISVAFSIYSPRSGLKCSGRDAPGETLALFEAGVILFKAFLKSTDDILILLVSKTSFLLVL